MLHTMFRIVARYGFMSEKCTIIYQGRLSDTQTEAMHLYSSSQVAVDNSLMLVWVVVVVGKKRHPIKSISHQV